ncbi:MAG: dihydroneopterin triphosphate diphosphatase [Sulfuriferula sp.]
MGRSYKQPVSVLVVIYTLDLQVLLLERADQPGLWQSVTGSRDGEETLLQTAVREVAEETGLETQCFQLSDWGYQNTFSIYPQWRHRYAPGITENTEHVFGLMLPKILPIIVSPREHLGYTWLSVEAAAEKCFSPSNAEAIRRLIR